jgi:exosortase
MSGRRLHTYGWTIWHLVGAIILGAIGVWSTRTAWADIYFIASQDEEANHIFLVPIVAVWMIWARRARLRYCPPAGTFVGPPIVAAGWLMSAYGYNNAVQALWHAGAVTVVLGCVLSVLGKNVLFRFLPAFAVLAFLVPVPGSLRQALAVPLQTATAVATQALLETFGVPIERSANMLTLNGHNVTVAEACNGMRMVFALVLVSYAFAFSMPLRNSVRAIVLIASPLAAIVCNVIRLIPTVWFFGYAEQDFATRFHDVSGWIMLPVAFFMLLGIIRALRWALVPVARFNLAYQ